MKKAISSSKEYHLGNHTNPKECHFRKVNGRKMWAAKEGGRKNLILTRWAAIQYCLWKKVSKVSFSLMKNVMTVRLSIWSRPLFAPFYKGRMKRNFYGKFAEKSSRFCEDVEKEEKSHNRFLLVERCSRKSNFVSSNWRLGLEIYSSVKP